MAPSPRLRNEHIRPVDAPIPRATARRLLTEFLTQALQWPAARADGAAVSFDLLADDHDRHQDEAFAATASRARAELQSAAAEADDLQAELSRVPVGATEARALHADLRQAQQRIARCRQMIEDADARRAAAKADYRKLLLRFANEIVSEDGAP